MAEARDGGFSRYARQARPALRRTAFLLTGDWHEAEDLVQRTLIALHRHWDRLERHDRISGYVRAIMIRLVYSDRRSQRWSREVPHELPPEPEPLADPYTLVVDRILLMNALAGLGPRQRAAVVLRYWEDRSVEETASAMGSEGSTVRSQTVRALATLRTALTAASDGTAGEARRNAEDAARAAVTGR